MITQNGLDTVENVGSDHFRHAWEVFLRHISEEEAAMLEKVFSRVLAAEK